MLRTVLRTSALLVAAGLVTGGLLRHDAMSDGRWLALLAGAWALVLLAVWPSSRSGPVVPERSIVKVGMVVASVFALLAVHLARLQVVRQETTVRRRAVDPQTDEVIANPREVNGDLRFDRGRILDRDDRLIADTRVTDGIGLRRYPDPISAYVAGYYSPLLYGKAGLEATFDEELRGTDGHDLITEIEGQLLHRPPTGLDLRLTLSADLQAEADRLLDGRIGAVVLLDVATGAVRALASSPHYDPEPLFAVDRAGLETAQEYWGELIDDPDRPLVLRATSGLYTPGSTFKLITTAAIIDTGFATPDDTYRDDGELNVEGHIIVERNRPDDSVTIWTLRQALGFSLNVVYAQIGLELGSELMQEYAERFGFGQDVPFDVPVARSQVASSDSFLDALPALADTAFGQGELLVSPLQMAMVTAALANSGRMMRPYLVETIAERDGSVVRRIEPTVWKRPISEESAAIVRDLMVDSVVSGYASGATIDGLVVGGKSGTAETGDGDPHAWFVGFVGDIAPRYAVAVVLEHGGTGLAAPLDIAREMLARAMSADS